MAKYAGTLSSEEVCKLEVRECKGILKKYHATKEDTEKITGMIEQAYHMLSESYRIGRAIDAYMKDEIGEDADKDFMAKWMSHTKEPGKHLTECMIKEAENYFKEQDRLENFRRIK